MTTTQPQHQSAIDMVGLRHRAQSRAHMADHGFSVAGYDKGPNQVEALRKHSAGRNICGSENINDLIALLPPTVCGHDARAGGYTRRFGHQGFRSFRSLVYKRAGTACSEHFSHKVFHCARSPKVADKPTCPVSLTCGQDFFSSISLRKQPFNDTHGEEQLIGGSTVGGRNFVLCSEFIANIIRDGWTSWRELNMEG